MTNPPPSAPAAVGRLAEILPSAAALLGVPGAVDTLALGDRVGEVRRVVVVLVDGMGLHLLPAMAPHAPLLSAVLRGTVGRLDELRSPFPSTTPVSLVSFGTGVSPGEHGVLGFTVNVPGTDRVLTHITWRDDPPPRQWQPVATWFERVAAAGVGASVVLPAAFAGSGLTDAAYRGAKYRAVADDVSNAENAAQLLAAVADRPGLVFGYTAALDTAAHVHGIASTQWQRAAAGVDILLTRIVEGLPSDTALLVTADHGGLDIPMEDRPDIDRDPRLSAGLRVVAGEPRVRYLHTLDGATADVIDTWRGLLGGRARILTREQAVGEGLFGPTTSRHAARIGDVVVICRGDTVVLASAHEPKDVSRLVGFHGAESAEETAIPLITVRG